MPSASHCRWLSCVMLAAAVTWLSGQQVASAQFIDSTPEAKAAADKTPPEDETVLAARKLPAPIDAKKLPKPDEVWVDTKNRRVLVDGFVSLREGYLEMFACIVGTKEHESVVAVKTKAQTVHAALLALGAKPGTPVQWQPEFKPPTGTEIDIEVHWLDDNGKWQTAKAQDWIRNSKTEEPMKQPFVFAGSGFWKEPETGKEYYMAESGDFICVSNFTTAMLDVPIESSQSNEALNFEANPKRIPELGTPVRLVLTPKLKDEKKPGGE
jgi:hypothetical protein